MPTRKQLEQQYIEDKAFWGSVSSRWRALAGGLLLGAAIGAGLGLASAGLLTLFGVTGISFGLAVGALSVAGALIGMNLWGSAGQVSGAISAGLMAQKELEAGTSPALNQEVTLSKTPLAPTQNTPFFNWKVIGITVSLSAIAGAGLALGGALPAFLLLGQTAGTGMAAAAGATSLGLFGTIFGLSFKPFQSFKRHIDGIFEGRVSGRSLPAHEEIKAQLLAQEPEQSQGNLHSFHTEKLLQERQAASTLGFRVV